MQPTLLGLELPLNNGQARAQRALAGAVELPVDSDTAERFGAKCAPFPDDAGHLWWVGAIDAGADGSGGYGRFQTGRGSAAVITTAHRFAWTLERGAVPEGLVLRHRCDEPLCVAVDHLELGTSADNSWDAVERPVRAADADTRGSAGRSREIRIAVLVHLATGVATPASLGAAVRAVMSLGDPNRFQLMLWPDDPADGHAGGENRLNLLDRINPGAL